MGRNALVRLGVLFLAVNVSAHAGCGRHGTPSLLPDGAAGNGEIDQAVATGGAAEMGGTGGALGLGGVKGTAGALAAGTGGSPNAGGSLGTGGVDAGAGSALDAGGEPSCPTPTGAAVTLTQTGNNFVLSNGLATVTISASGTVTQVAKGTQNLMRSGDSLYVSESGGASYYALAASSYSVVQQSADTVELSFLDKSAGNHDMNWDIHYVMRRGVSGFYYFLIADTLGRPAASLSELRTVHRFNPALLSNGYNGERHGELPTPAQNATFTTATQLQDTTWPLPNGATLHGTPYNEGPVYSKYDWATYRTEDSAHGLYGSGFGAWLLSPSWEFYTGGPAKQELMVHQDNLILNMYHGGHFGSAVSTASPANWQKIYGPNLVYVNAGTDAQVIADALGQATSERGQWPYCWMKSSLYPLAPQRGTATGKIAEAHGQSVAGAMVVLAQEGTLLDQGYDYMFWSQADGSGDFSIPNVRAGTYAVHVYATQGTLLDDPAHGEIVKTAVAVVAGSNDLGTLAWTPPYHANLLWSIGTADRSAGEFRFNPNLPAGPSNLAGATGRMYGLSATQPVWDLPPADTTYTIGTSQPSTDWYFAQSVSGTWTVNFTLTSVPPGGAFLAIGLAGAARGPTLKVGVNGHQVASETLGNDQSLYRSVIRGGRYALLLATVPAADLRTGANTTTFQLTNGGGGTGLYYDAITFSSD